MHTKLKPEKLKGRLTYLYFVYLTTLLAAQTIQRQMIRLMNNELERISNEAMWSNLKYYPGICLDRVRKITKTSVQDSRSPGRDLNPGPSE
jgi:hypothetical protein